MITETNHRNNFGAKHAELHAFGRVIVVIQLQYTLIHLLYHVVATKNFSNRIVRFILQQFNDVLNVQDPNILATCRNLFYQTSKTVFDLILVAIDLHFKILNTTLNSYILLDFLEENELNLVLIKYCFCFLFSNVVVKNFLTIACNLLSLVEVYVCMSYQAEYLWVNLKCLLNTDSVEEFLKTKDRHIDSISVLCQSQNV